MCQLSIIQKHHWMKYKVNKENKIHFPKQKLLR